MAFVMHCGGVLALHRVTDGVAAVRVSRRVTTAGAESRSSALLRAQGRGRIDARGTACGQIGGQQGYDAE